MITETPTPVHQALATSLLPGNWKPRFFSIWVGQAFSLVGSALTQFVLLWWITNTTNSAGALAIAGAMALLPQALLEFFSPDLMRLESAHDTSHGSADRPRAS